MTKYISGSIFKTFTFAIQSDNINSGETVNWTYIIAVHSHFTAAFGPIYILAFNEGDNWTRNKFTYKLHDFWKVDGFKRRWGTKEAYNEGILLFHFVSNILWSLVYLVKVMSSV